MIYAVPADPATKIVSLPTLRSRAKRRGYRVSYDRNTGAFTLVDSRLRRPIVGLEHVGLPEIAQAITGLFPNDWCVSLKVQSAARRKLRELSSAHLLPSPTGARRRGITHARHEYTAMDMKKYASKGFVNVDYIQKHGPIEGTIEQVEPGQFDKPNVTLSTGHKFSLNKTNVGALMREFGEDSDTWLGNTIRLVVGELKFQGGMQTAVVVEPMSPAIKKKEVKDADGKPTPDMSDEIPF